MKPRNIPLSQHLRRSKKKTERGIALITTLLLLLLLTGISITMVLSVSSDMLVNGYYRDFRGSFYASDSGLNLARQSMLTGVTNVVPAVFDPITPPIPSSTASSVASNVLGNYSGSNAPYSLNTGGGANSWPEKFTLTKSTLALTPGVNPVTTKDAKGNVNSYTYTFQYNLTTVGQSQGSEAATLSDSGNFKIVVAPGSSTTTSSFAAFGMFIDQYAAVRRRRPGARYDYRPGVHQRCVELQLVGRV